MSELSASDVMAMTGDNGAFGNGGVWIFALLILLMLGGGGFGLNGGGNTARQEDIQRAVNLNSIQTGQADIGSTVQRTTNETISAIKDASYNNLSEVRDTQAAMNAGFTNLQNSNSAMALENANSKFDIINAIHSEGEATRNMYQQSEIQRLRDQVSALNMQNAMAGVVRYPMASTYTSGTNPFCNALTCSGF